MDNGATHRRHTGNAQPLPSKVIQPRIPTWIEERHFVTSLGVNGRFTGCLTQGTRDAGESEVAFARFPAGGDGNDVIDVEGCDLAHLSQATVLTMVFGSLYNETAQGGRNVGHCRGREELGLLLHATGIESQVGEKLGQIDKPCCLVAFGRRELFPSVLLVQQEL